MSEVLLTLTMHILYLFILKKFFLFSLEFKVLSLHLQKDVFQSDFLMLVRFFLEFHAIDTFFKFIVISEGFLHNFIDEVDASVFFDNLGAFFDCFLNVFIEFLVFIELF